MWVLLSPSLHHMWCCGHGHCAACGFTVMVIVPRVVSWLWLLHHMGVTITVFVLRVVLWSWSLCHMDFAVTAIALCGCHSHGHCAMWVSWVPSLCCMWFCGCGGWPWKERMATCLLAREVVRAW